MKALAKTIKVADFNRINDHIVWIRANRVSQHDYRQFPAKLINIDFSYSRFLKPYHIAPLASLIYEYQQKGFKIKISKIPDAIKEYFETFNFYQFCKNEDENSFPTPLNPKTFPLWRIDPKAINLYPKEVQDYFENNQFKGSDLFALSNSLAELMNNIFDHSGSKIPGFTFTQFNSRNNQIITCVCDFGVGIPNHVNKFLKDNGQLTFSNEIALQKALEFKFSTLTKPHNRGFGWDTILNSVKDLKGKILIISNDALYQLMYDGTSIINLLESNFPGTLVVIYLNTKNLPVKEEELTDELIIL
jgi:anti-sigma regulatory factor (Ser/Thr protein kinase)